MTVDIRLLRTPPYMKIDVWENLLYLLSYLVLLGTGVLEIENKMRNGKGTFV